MLRLEHLEVHVADTLLLGPISLELRENEVTCLIGPSGCGKTSVIKWMAGILPPEMKASGTLTLDGRQVGRHDRFLSYQPQSDAMFPWLTIGENVCLGLEVAGMSRGEAWAKAAPLFDPFGLKGTEHLFPRQLSGGMRQRAAFLRTIVQDSRYILLDEPFSALDAVTKIRMQEWLVARLEADPRGVLMVTHDLHEASRIANRLLVMSSRPGRILADLPINLPRGQRSETALADLREHLKSLLLEDDK
jgi:ABC-type nitrate/sulfonate/bicarbonate transport system ATPase subunit